MNFSMVILNRSIRTMPNYATWIQIVSLFTLKLKIFIKILQIIFKKRFNTSSYEVNRPLPTEKNKKVIGLMKDELGGKVITEFAALRPKTYSYFMDDGKSDKKSKGTKKK